MKKQILVIKDPECEVGFDTLCEYTATIAERVQDENTVVIPIWPHGEMELIGDKRKMKLFVKNYKEILNSLEKELEGE